MESGALEEWNIGKMEQGKKTGSYRSNIPVFHHSDPVTSVSSGAPGEAWLI